MGRIPSDTPSKSVLRYGIKSFTPFYRRIAERLVSGQRQCRITKEFGISQSRLSIIINSPVFIEELRRLEAQRDRNFVQIRKGICFREVSK